MDIEEKFELLISEIKKIGVEARECFYSNDFSNERKSDGSVVTKLEKSVEHILRTFINKHFTDDAVIGEEEDDKIGTSGFVWHIDPIDGTDNFLRRIPFCSVSVARLGDTEDGSFGIVYNPVTDHIFYAHSDLGAYENGQAYEITVKPLEYKYTIGVGSGRAQKWLSEVRLNIVTPLAKRFGRCTSHGSAALTLAYVSTGRIDGFLILGLSTFDYAAGLYLVKAAGGVISVLEDGVWSEWAGSIKDLCDEHGKIIFASHVGVHQEVLDFVGDLKGYVEE